VDWLTDQRRASVFSEVLHAINLRNVIFCRGHWTSKWGFSTKANTHARFHFLTSGSCWLEIENLIEPTSVGEGDLVIVAPGQAYCMRDDLSSPLQSLEEALESRSPEDKRDRILHGGTGGKTTKLLFGRFVIEERDVNPLVASLPPALIVRGKSDAGELVRSTFLLMDAELAAGRPGAEAVVSRLMDVIFLQALQSTFASEPPHKPSWITALNDPVIGKALIAIHTRLEAPISVGSLASEVAMSRSSFSARFAELTGEPPMSYVTRWRINRSAYLLRSTNEKIAAVAARVGYDSPAAFVRAFKRSFGVSPGAYRNHYSIGSDL
jgi:AraC-like DNA-binding protein